MELINSLIATLIACTSMATYSNSVQLEAFRNEYRKMQDNLYNRNTLVFAHEKQIAKTIVKNYSSADKQLLINEYEKLLNTIFNEKRNQTPKEFLELNHTWYTLCIKWNTLFRNSISENELSDLGSTIDDTYVHNLLMTIEADLNQADARLIDFISILITKEKIKKVSDELNNLAINFHCAPQECCDEKIGLCIDATEKLINELEHPKSDIKENVFNLLFHY